MMERTLSSPQWRSSTFPWRTVPVYASYAEAQRAVDNLSDRKFPAQRVAIVAEGLRLVEQVTGRLNLGRAALSGAGSGALTGALLGSIFGLFDWLTPLVSGLALAANGPLVGAAVGAVFGLLAHVLSGGQRDFTSTSGMQAEQYNIMVDEEVADEADRLLAGRR